MRNIFYIFQLSIYCRKLHVKSICCIYLNIELKAYHLFYAMHMKEKTNLLSRVPDHYVAKAFNVFFFISNC